MPWWHKEPGHQQPWYWATSGIFHPQHQKWCVNSLRPRDAYMHHQLRPSLAQIMACRLFGTNPLSEPNAVLLSVGPLGTNFSEISIKIHTFSFKKMHLKTSSVKWQPFCLSLNVLKLTTEVAVTVQQSIKAVQCASCCEIVLWNLLVNVIIVMVIAMEIL